MSVSKSNKLHLKKSFTAFLKLIRLPNLIILAITQYFVRIFIIGPKQNWLHIILDPYFFMLCLATTLIAAAGYIINDYYDIKIDRINNPKRGVVGKIFTRRVAMSTHFIFNIVALILGLFLGWKIWCTIFLSGFLMWLYSNILKRLALWGNLTIAFLSALSIYFIHFMFGINKPMIIAFSVFAFFISLIREIIKDIEDVKGDEAFGCKTLPIVWGIPKTKTFLVFIAGAFLLITILFFRNQYNDFLMIYFLGLVIPSLFYLVFRIMKANHTKDYSFLSSLCKFIMVLGIISMIFL